MQKMLLRNNQEDRRTYSYKYHLSPIPQCFLNDFNYSFVFPQMLPFQLLIVYGYINRSTCYANLNYMKGKFKFRKKTSQEREIPIPMVVTMFSIRSTIIYNIRAKGGYWWMQLSTIVQLYHADSPLFKPVIG